MPGEFQAMKAILSQLRDKAIEYKKNWTQKLMRKKAKKGKK